ncbi:uncharacterized protein LOC116604832 [Nematostella vectensis]|uniref:uncharacterized protein LOC116604832 n=1 Tax=Nematostella vectensis TaxID=45351 RepID=UPI00138FBC01|nr:uncharacterized protein LOC116604832 [Nematostella vectensis]
MWRELILLACLLGLGCAAKKSQHESTDDAVKRSIAMSSKSLSDARDDDIDHYTRDDAYAALAFYDYIMKRDSQLAKRIECKDKFPVFCRKAVAFCLMPMYKVHGNGRLRRKYNIARKFCPVSCHNNGC